MKKDYRSHFIKDVETELIKFYDQEDVQLVSNIVTKMLSQYEIAERCTDLVPVDGINEKLMKRYAACLSVDGKSKRTIYQYLYYIKRLHRMINKTFPEMGPYDIRFFLAMEKERGIKNVTLQNIQNIFSAFFQWMVNDEVISSNPVAMISKIKVPKEIKKPFSDVEIDMMRDACKTTKERALVELLLSTGVRVAELSAMKVCDIDQTALSVHVVKGKGSKERMTYITEVALKHLRDYWNDSFNREDYVFYNKKKTRLREGGIRFILNKIGERSGVDGIHPHRFRRTFATNLAKRGMEIQKIQRLLGHSNLNTTLRYVTIDDTDVQVSYRKHIAQD